MPAPLTDDELALLVSVLDLARDGKTDELTAALQKGVPANLTSASGDSLLILASYHVHEETVAALLAAGADPERINDRGQTALGAAVFRRSVPIMQALLAVGAGPHTGTRSAIQIAEFFDLAQMAALLHARA